MAFVYVAEPTFSRTVKCKVPVDGGFEEQSFKATFRVLTSEAIQGYDLSTSDGSNKFLRDVVKEVDDIVDADNKPLPPSDKLRDYLIQMPYARKPLHDEYFAGINGAAEGN